MRRITIVSVGSFLIALNAAWFFASAFGLPVASWMAVARYAVVFVALSTATNIALSFERFR